MSRNREAAAYVQPGLTTGRDVFSRTADEGGLEEAASAQPR